MWEKCKYVGLALLGFWVLAAGCAKIMPLTGGDEDRTPPQFRSAKPDTFSLNFKGKTITIRFDEYINLVDPTREIIVSPPVEPAPEFIATGQSVKIRFKDSLRPNVTYVINFGKSIEDITEANKSTGFTFVFSTGSFIDSGGIRGNIVDAFTGKPAEGYKVMLYNTDVSDSFPYKEKPFYLAYTNEAGNFNLRNLRAGRYRIFALQEDNNNYIFDRSGEKIAFFPGNVATDDSIPFKMVAFAEEGGPVKFNKAKSVSAVRTDFYFSGNAGDVSIIPFKGLADTSYFAYEFNGSKDTVILWHNPVSADTVGFIITDENLRDTTVFKANKGPVLTTGSGKRNRNVPAAAMTLDANGNSKFDLYTPPTLTLAEPFKHADTSRIRLLADSVRIPYRLVPDSVSPRKYQLVFDRSSKLKYLLVCDSAAFTSISGKVSNHASYTFGFREAIEYALVRVNYEDSIIKFPKIWQLLKDDKVIRVKFAPANQNDVEFNRLEPGSYRLRLILDENGNKRWDTGKYIENRQPERVLYLTEPIELKAGWDSEITWKMQKGKQGK